MVKSKKPPAFLFQIFFGDAIDQLMDSAKIDGKDEYQWKKKVLQYLDHQYLKLFRQMTLIKISSMRNKVSLKHEMVIIGGGCVPHNVAAVTSWNWQIWHEDRCTNGEHLFLHTEERELFIISLLLVSCKTFSQITWNFPDNQHSNQVD